MMQYLYSEIIYIDQINTISNTNFKVNKYILFP